MPDILQEIQFTTAGLNVDDDKKYIANGDAPYRLNILIGEDGANGVITNMKGNHEPVAPYPLTYSNAYAVVGSYYNELTRKCYYFIFSQPYDCDGSGTFIYDNLLLCYNEDAHTIDLIFLDEYNYFGLSPNYLMRDCKMIGNWLYFNPKVSEPKMIDVVMGYNYSNYDVYNPFVTYIYGNIVTYYGGLFLAIGAVGVGQTPVTNTALWERIGDCYQDTAGLNYDSDFHYAFNVIKQPPIARPVLGYGSDTDIDSNNVRQRMFRFTYRYKYFDNTYSVFSALSDISIPIDDEEWNGEIFGDTNSNNYVTVTVGLHSAALVREVEIAFQEIGGDWKRCKIINRIEQALLTVCDPYTFNFYNNESYVVIDNTLVTKICDSVPRTAQSTEIINKNVLCYAQCKEGFNNLNKDEIIVHLTPETSPLGIPYTVDTLRHNCVPGNITQTTVWDDTLGLNIYYTNVDIGSWFAGAGIVVNDVFILGLDGQQGSPTALAAGDVDTADHLALAVAGEVHVELWYTITGTGATTALHIASYYSNSIVDDLRFYKPTATIQNLTKYRGFKTGANHPFCIFYYDIPLRRWDAQTSKENTHSVGLEMIGTTVYVPMLNMVTPIVDTSNRWIINWEIFHQPPAGAKYWRWGYAGNTLCSYFLQYIIESVADGVGEESTMSVIDITPLQTLKDTVEPTWNQFPHSLIDPYTWAKGDRIRFITEETNPAVAGTTLGNLLGAVYDYEIIKQDDTNNTIYINQIDHVALDIGENTLVEIYRPIKTSTKLEFFEFGSLMPIIEDSSGNKVHGGITADQDYGAGTPATGVFYAGDVYHITRAPSKPLCSVAGWEHLTDFHESMWYSDFYDSDDWGKGKVGVETSFNERNLKIIRFSNQYLQNTQINGLSTFDGLDYKELNDTYGEIMVIVEIGDTLKVYQERKPSSILIGRTEYSDTGGKTIEVTSSKILGAIRYSTTNWGTEFRESIIRNNRYVYGFDIYNGAVWRDSANGIFPISGRYAGVGGDVDYKMDTYFKNKSQALLASGVANVDVLTTWDEKYGLFYITFRDFVTEANDETVVFHEPSNRWITFASFDKTGEYNRILELTYSVVRGFDSGIGYEFDEETRFAIFNLHTALGIEALYPLLTFIVDEDATTYIVDDTGEIYIISD